MMKNAAELWRTPRSCRTVFLFCWRKPVRKRPGTGCAASAVRHCSKGIGDAAPTSIRSALVPANPDCQIL